MNIMVTGATGFIGKNLVSVLLEKKFDVSIIIRPNSDVSDLPQNIKCYVFDGSYLCLDAILKSNNPDVVLHLASLFLSQHTSEDVARLIRSNVEFGSLLLEAMNKNNCHRLINTGTSWQHFQNNEYNPVNLYAATKQAFEDICRYYVESFGFSIINLHLFDSYGEGDKRPKLLSLLKRMIYDGSSLDMSPGEQEILLVHVNDIVNGYILAIQHVFSVQSGVNMTYSIGDPKDKRSLKELISIIERITGKSLNINWGRRDYRDREVLKLWDKYDLVPGWTSEIPLEEGLKEYFDET